ncbi:hypothetical protein F9K85_19760 [Brucella tritici]|uniref:Uncharacterized protein n=1 Tax=Brucella tritici TaxID=94626 RepID=A0A6L3YCY3_9HYPH|nr:hypothetical protein F9K85_19760 [Brucella tritici]KAB2677265.1 hypothetical protein F9L08_25370 [Brucella tritici]
MMPLKPQRLTARSSVCRKSGSASTLRRNFRVTSYARRRLRAAFSFTRAFPLSLETLEMLYLFVFTHVSPKSVSTFGKTCSSCKPSHKTGERL